LKFFKLWNYSLFRTKKFTNPKSRVESCKRSTWLSSDQRSRWVHPSGRTSQARPGRRSSRTSL